MAGIEAGALNIEQKFRRFSTENLFESWREAHYAAQAAAELGKGWAEPRGDDSHTSFAWFRGEDGRGLEGVPATGPKGLVCRLKFEGLELSLYDGKGRTVADFTLAGHTLAEAMAWMETACTHELGPRLQASVPAPDLPAHAVASGAVFTPDPDGENDVADVYDATFLVLERLRGVDSRFGEVRCWPHHFDMASLAVVEQDGAGAMTKTIGVGITPPDGLDDHGYWYVSPWAREGVAGEPVYRALSHGRWQHRGGGVSMALLSVHEVAGEGDRSHKLAAFLSESINACLGVLDV